jgi:hypothetical protein
VRVQKLSMQASVSYAVLGNDDLPIPAVEAFLVNFVWRGKAPATTKAYAHDLETRRNRTNSSGNNSNIAPADNVVQAGQAARRYSCTMPPSRSCRHMLRSVMCWGSVIGAGTGRSGAACFIAWWVRWLL